MKKLNIYSSLAKLGLVSTVLLTGCSQTTELKPTSPTTGNEVPPTTEVVPTPETYDYYKINGVEDFNLETFIMGELSYNFYIPDDICKYTRENPEEFKEDFIRYQGNGEIRKMVGKNGKAFYGPDNQEILDYPDGKKDWLKESADFLVEYCPQEMETLQGARSK